MKMRVRAIVVAAIIWVGLAAVVDPSESIKDIERMIS